MKKAILGCMVLFFGIQIGVAQKTKQYISKLGKFSVLQYATVKERTKENANSTLYRAAYRFNDMVFVVSSTLEKHQIKNVSSLLKASVKTFLTAVKGTPINQKRIKENGVKGIYVALNLKKNKMHAEYKVFSKGLYLYQLMIFSKSEKYNQKLAAAYFKSFKILQ